MNTTASAEAIDRDLRDRLAAVMGSDKRHTQAAIAREIGISSSAMNQWLSGKYGGDNDTIETKVTLWLEQLQARRIAGDQMPTAPKWVNTPTGQRVIGALGYAQVAGDIAIIYGGAGLGKSTAIGQYAGTSLNVWHVTMKPSNAAIVTALKAICTTLNLPRQGGAADLAEVIQKRISGTNGLLVIDEAQHLSTLALDEIRSLHDATGIGLAFVGNTELYARMTGGNKAVPLDRLFSRIGKRLPLQRATTDDIHALIEAWGIDDGKCRATLVDIAKKPGALRTLTKVLRLAAMNAAALQVTVCCEHITAAWRELGGAE